MSRYIDVDKAYETARKYHKDFAQSIADFTSLSEVLEDTPSANVVSVVRCKDCKYFQDRYVELPDGSKIPYKKGESSVPLSAGINVGSYCTRIDYAIVHGYRYGEPSVDETRLWTKPDDFCSYGEPRTPKERGAEK